MRKETRKDYSSEEGTEKILRLAARECKVPSRSIDPFVKEGLERYEKAVEITNANFSAFKFRKLF